MERRTSGDASSCLRGIGLYPTPCATPYGSNAGGASPGTIRPSPDTTARTWPTPKALEEKTHINVGGNPTLFGAMLAWPTPITSDAQGNLRALQEKKSETAAHPGTTLSDAMLGHQGQPMRKHGPDGLVLCPEFVEGLMGFPEAWTLIDDESAFACLEIRSYRSKLLRHLKRCRPVL